VDALKVHIDSMLKKQEESLNKKVEGLASEQERMAKMIQEQMLAIGDISATVSFLAENARN